MNIKNFDKPTDGFRSLPKLERVAINTAVLKISTQKIDENKQNWMRQLEAYKIDPSTSVFKFSARFSCIFNGLYQGTQEDSDEVLRRSALLEDLEDIKKRFGQDMDENTAAALKHHRSFLLNYPLTLTNEHLSAYQHIGYVVSELKENEGKYSQKTVQIVLCALLKMTAFGIREETLQAYMCLNAIKEQPKSFDLVKDEAGGNLAILRRIPTGFGDMLCERLAYEMDHVLGSDAVPTTIRLSSGYTLQKYISPSKTVSDLLQEEQGAEIIRSMDLGEVQTYLTFGLIRGRRDGHGNNTIIHSMDGNALKLYDIDEEEDFLSPNIGLDTDGNSANEGTQGSSMAALGFPQASLPYLRVLLKLFSWAGLKEKALRQLACLHRQNRESYLHVRGRALEERLDKILEICRFESQKDTPTLTPREVYFLIFGKDYLYERMRRLGYTDYEFFQMSVNNHDDCKLSFQQTISCTFSRNLEKFNTPLPPMLSMESGKNERYPGDEFLQEVKKGLIEKDVVLIPIDSKAFDENGWTQYKNSCKEPKDFMLSHFFNGFFKRMTRQLSFLFPHCMLDVIAGEKEELYLEIKKKEYLISKERLFLNKDRQDPLVFMEIASTNFNLSKWKATQSLYQINYEILWWTLSPLERATYIWLKNKFGKEGRVLMDTKNKPYRLVYQKY